jgi:hypothetical protein
MLLECESWRETRSNRIYFFVNGDILEKQMNKETKLRFHNITAKAALKFGSEVWVLKKRGEQRLELVT